MINLLAIDTCTEACSVSLYGNNIKVSRFIRGVGKSSSLILPLCEEVFTEAKLTVSELSAVLYTKGPGAFTGVRMCLAAAQSIAFAHNIPSIGFSTLELLGFSATKKYQTDKVAISIDARMGEIYWGIYQTQKLTHESLRKPSDVEALGVDFIGVGTGWGVYQKVLSEQTGIDNYQADFYPMAQDLIDLYLNQAQDRVDDKSPLPTYLRNTVAQKSHK